MASRWGFRRFQLRIVAAITAVITVIVASSSLVMWLVERDGPHSNIHSYPVAVWWAMETITTVGYGDHHPTTTLGRVVAGFLMVAGVALVGVITATVVTWFFAELDVLREVREIEREEERTEATLEEVLAQLERLHERLDRIERRGRD
ncbi:pH-gated potassium channel KcsA [Nocardioides panacisoli]|uniref:PH-gated potassium channel KcsA n=1 Tax=Nocardioides panacisoli TaxID=627624 RepID=A0ABP7I2P1_9ACTN